MYDLIIGFAHLQELGIWHGKFSPEWVARTTAGYAVMEDPVFGIEQMDNLKIDDLKTQFNKPFDSVASFGM